LTQNSVAAAAGCIGLVKNGVLSYEEGWKTIEHQSKILKHLAESILDVSRIENGILSFNMKPLDVTVLIETIAS
jgi:hypothetical protein